MIGKPPASRNACPSSPGRLADTVTAAPSDLIPLRTGYWENALSPAFKIPNSAWSTRVNASPSITVLRGLLGAEMESAALTRRVMIPGRMNNTTLSTSTLNTSTLGSLRDRRRPQKRFSSVHRRIRAHPRENADAPIVVLSLRALDRGLEGALGEDATEVRLVLDGALQVGLHIHAVGGLRGGGLDGRGVQALARERRLHALGAHGLGAGAGDADARLRALAILVERDDGGHADDGEARRRVRELQIGGAGALGERGHADLDEQLVLLQRRLHEALEPVVHLHRALLLALADELGAERDHGGGHVGGGIAVGQRAADRPLVAHGGVADHGRGLRHDRAFALQHLRGLYLPVGGHRPERDRAAGLLDAGEPTHLAQVDEMLRLGEAQLHHRDQAVTTREDLGVVELAEQLQGLRDAGGGVILERGWVHGRLLYRFGPAAPAVLAAWMVFHTRSGESGIVSM